MSIISTFVYLVAQQQRIGLPKPANAGDAGLIPGSGRSLREGNGNPLQYSCLKISTDKRSLMCYSPWEHKSQTRLSD